MSKRALSKGSDDDDERDTRQRTYLRSLSDLPADMQGLVGSFIQSDRERLDFATQVVHKADKKAVQADISTGRIPVPLRILSKYEDMITPLVVCSEARSFADDVTFTLPPSVRRFVITHLSSNLKVNLNEGMEDLTLRMRCLCPNTQLQLPDSIKTLDLVFQHDDTQKLVNWPAGLESLNYVGPETFYKAGVSRLPDAPLPPTLKSLIIYGEFFDAHTRSLSALPELQKLEWWDCDRTLLTVPYTQQTIDWGAFFPKLTSLCVPYVVLRTHYASLAMATAIRHLVLRTLMADTRGLEMPSDFQFPPQLDVLVIECGAVPIMRTTEARPLFPPTLRVLSIDYNEDEELAWCPCQRLLARLEAHDPRWTLPESLRELHLRCSGCPEELSDIRPYVPAECNLTRTEDSMYKKAE